MVQTGKLLQGKTSTDATCSDVARLRDLYGEINAEHKKYSGEPAAIDFDAYREAINSQVLSMSSKKLTTD